VLLRKLLKKFRETGSLLDKNRNRQKSVLTPGILQDIQTAITRSPHKSLWKLSAQTYISLGSAHTAVRKMLKFYSYPMQVFHELIPGNCAKRVNCWQWFKNLILDNIGVLDQMFFTDRAWFHLNGYVNIQNYQTWRTENPHNYTETALHPQKLGVWCAVSRLWIIVPLFFETTINAETYQELIQQFIALLQMDGRNCWCQQDSATAYTAASTMEIPHEFFGENLIFKGVWPPRSPDLSSPDFFLWSYLKDTVYRSNQWDPNSWRWILLVPSKK